MGILNRFLQIVVLLACCVYGGEVYPVSVNLTAAQQMRLDDYLTGKRLLGPFVKILAIGNPFMIDLKAFSTRLAEVEAVKASMESGNVEFDRDDELVVLSVRLFNTDAPYRFVYRKTTTSRSFCKQKNSEYVFKSYQFHFLDKWIVPFFLMYVEEGFNNVETRVNSDENDGSSYTLWLIPVAGNVIVPVKIQYKW